MRITALDSVESVEENKPIKHYAAMMKRDEDNFVILYKTKQYLGCKTLS
jgi:hypothetical protein